MRLAGALWERRAERHLRRAGLVLIARNYHCRLGEIDLIMRDRDTLAFVEVRYRSPSGYATAAESIGPRKQRRIIQAARHFLATNPRWSAHRCRFDVVAIDGGFSPQIEWMKDAFQT